METDLPNMFIKIVVKDRHRVRADKALCHVIIGPNMPEDTCHWEEMTNDVGNMVRKIHALQVSWMSRV